MEKMKIFLLAVAFTLAATPAFAKKCGGGDDDCVDAPPTTVTTGAVVINGQVQGQDTDIEAKPTKLFGGTAGAQGQFGLGSATEGGKAWDNQSQFQSTGEYKFAENAKGSFTEAGHSTTQEQNAKGIAANGDYSYVQGQAQLGGSAAKHDNKGTQGIAGSAYAGGGLSAIDASTGSKVVLDQKQTFDGSYASYNQGKRGYTYNAGTQSVVMLNRAKVTRADDRAVSSSVGVIQAGGTKAINSGDGTRMGGSGAAIAAGTATGGGIDCDVPINSSAKYKATQEHTYEQSMQNKAGTAYQYSTGTVGTTIRGNTRK